MPTPPTPSKLDSGQILQAAFDDSTGKLRTDATLDIGSPAIEVLIDDSHDSVKIGNGNGTYADVTGSRALKIDGSAVTQPVSFSSLPLPTGASTSSNQLTGNASLSSLDSKFSTLGQKTSANSVPVVIASDQGAIAITGSITASNPSVGSNTSAIPTSSTLIAAKDGSGNLQPLKITGASALVTDSSATTQPISAAALPLPSGAATSANQTTSNTSLSSIDTKITTTANGLKVDGSNVTQPISAANLPLPAGASTSANQTSGNISLASIDSKLTDIGTDLGVNVLARTKTVTGIANTANTNIISLDASGYVVAYVTLVPTSGLTASLATVTIDTSVDNSVWLSVPYMISSFTGPLLSDRFPFFGSGTIPSPAQGPSKFAVSGRYFRVRIGTWTTPASESISATVFLSSIDNYDTLGRVNSTSIVDGVGVPINTDGEALSVKVGDSLGNLFNAGQGIKATSFPVVLPSDQTVPISGTITANIGTSGSLALDSTVAKDASLTTLNTSVNSLLKPASTLTAVTTVSAVTAITNALPTGTNSIGQVTANAGSNLNTSLLSLDTSVNGILVSQASSTSGEKGPLVQGAVTTSAPTYTTAQTNPLSLTTAGALRTDASGVTQPISAVSLPLPTGAATSANQITELTSLSSIVTSTANIPTIGTKTSAFSLPVVLASDQIALPLSSNAAQESSGNLALISSAQLNHSDLLLAILCELRAMRLAMTVLACESGRSNEGDFDPDSDNIRTIN